MSREQTAESGRSVSRRLLLVAGLVPAAAAGSCARSSGALLDVVPPVVTIVDGPDRSTAERSAVIELDVVDVGGSGVDRIECGLDGASWSACESSVPYDGLAAGEHTFLARAFDGAGNESAAAAHTWQVQSGRLDPDFGEQGVVVLDLGVGVAVANRVAIDVDGRIVVTGTLDGNLVAARFMADGSPDLTFDDDGWMTMSVCGAPHDYPHELVLDRDGRILVAGQCGDTHRGSLVYVVRIEASGQYDPGFGDFSDGGIGIDVGVGDNDRLGGIAELADGTILVAATDMSGNFSLVLARLTSDGQLDASFGSGGMVTHQSYLGWKFHDGMTLLSDGKVLVQNNFECKLERYFPTGALDTSYGVAGLVQLGIGCSLNPVIETDGGVLVSGQSNAAAGLIAEDLVVARILASGELDTRFGTHGAFSVMSPVAPGDVNPCGVARHADGRLVVVGNSGAHFVDDPCHTFIGRFHADGRPDRSFGDNGVLTWGEGTYQRCPNNMALDGDTIVVVGYFGEHQSGTSELFVARFLWAE